MIDLSAIQVVPDEEFAKLTTNRQAQAVPTPMQAALNGFSRAIPAAKSNDVQTMVKRPVPVQQEQAQQKAPAIQLSAFRANVKAEDTQPVRTFANPQSQQAYNLISSNPLALALNDFNQKYGAGYTPFAPGTPTLERQQWDEEVMQNQRDFDESVRQNNRDYDESVRQFNVGSDFDYAQLKQNQGQFDADMSYKRDSLAQNQSQFNAKMDNGTSQDAGDDVMTPANLFDMALEQAQNPAYKDTLSDTNPLLSAIDYLYSGIDTDKATRKNFVDELIRLNTAKYDGKGWTLDDIISVLRAKKLNSLAAQLEQDYGKTNDAGF